MQRIDLLLHVILEWYDGAMCGLIKTPTHEYYYDVVAQLRRPHDRELRMLSGRPIPPGTCEWLLSVATDPGTGIVRVPSQIDSSHDAALSALQPVHIGIYFVLSADEQAIFAWDADECPDPMSMLKHASQQREFG